MTVGMRVTHPCFGLGRVLRVSPSGRLAVVRFGRERKTLDDVCRQVRVKDLDAA
jgi:hypothetical protein